MLWQLTGAQSTPALTQAVSAAEMGPSRKGTDPRHTVSRSRLMLAIQREPLVLVGPQYFTTAQAVEPLTWVPVQLKSCAMGEP